MSGALLNADNVYEGAPVWISYQMPTDTNPRFATYSELQGKTNITNADRVSQGQGITDLATVDEVTETWEESENEWDNGRGEHMLPERKAHDEIQWDPFITKETTGVKISRVCFLGLGSFSDKINLKAVVRKHIFAFKLVEKTFLLAQTIGQKTVGKVDYFFYDPQYTQEDIDRVRYGKNRNERQVKALNDYNIWFWCNTAKGLIVILGSSQPYRQILADHFHGKADKTLPRAIICAPWDEQRGRDESSTRVKEFLDRFKFVAPFETSTTEDALGKLTLHVFMK